MWTNLKRGLAADVAEGGPVGGTDSAHGNLAFPAQLRPCGKNLCRGVTSGIVGVPRVFVETLDRRSAQAGNGGGLGDGERLPRRIAPALCGSLSDRRHGRVTRPA